MRFSLVRWLAAGIIALVIALAGAAIDLVLAKHVVVASIGKRTSEFPLNLSASEILQQFDLRQVPRPSWTRSASNVWYGVRTGDYSVYQQNLTAGSGKTPTAQARHEVTQVTHRECWISTLNSGCAARLVAPERIFGIIFGIGLVGYPVVVLIALGLSMFYARFHPPPLR